MRWLNAIWRSCTEKSLEQSTGKLEAAFFESVYRITYASGLSHSDCGFSYRCYSVFTKIYIALFISSELWCLFSLSSNLDTMVENINVIIIHLIILYRYTSMKINKEVFKKLTKSMESPNFDVSSPSRRKILQFWIRHHQNYFRLLLTLASSTLLVWYVYPLFDDVEYNFMVALRLPFDSRNPKLYPITYAIVLLMFHYISWFVVISDLTIQAYLMHLICQFDVLSDGFENIELDCLKHFKGHQKCTLKTDIKTFRMNIRFRQLYIEKLGCLVDQHQLILHNASQLRRILNAPMLGQLLASGMLICFVGYQVITAADESVGKLIMTILYLCYNLFVLYLLCRWCDEIKIKSEKIRLAVYCSGWERGMTTVPGVRARLALVALRASRPLVLTAGSIYDVSLTSYTTLVKTSYSALTVLLQARHRS